MQRLFVLSFLILQSLPAAAQAVSLIAQEMPGLLEQASDGSLPYNQLLAKLTQDSPVPLTIKVEPGYRGPRNWTDKQYQCIFGGISSPGHQMPPDDSSISPADWATIVFSRPFNLLEVHAWSAAGQKPVSDPADLAGKVIAVDEVLALDLQLHVRDLMASGTFIKVKTAGEALDLLLAGRVDVAMAYDNDAALYNGRHAGHEVHADHALTFLVLEESMMCWPGEGVEAFVAHVDRQIEALAASGELARLTMKDHCPCGEASSP